MDDLAIKRHAWKLGHYWAPDNPEGHNVTWDALPHIRMDDVATIQALSSLSKFQAETYATTAIAAHGRLPDWDGEVGPAMRAILDEPRCYVPDFTPPPGQSPMGIDSAVAEVMQTMANEGALPAVGDGNWKRCHGVGDYHSAAVRVNQSGIGSHLQPVFVEVLRRVQSAYAKIGLLFHFVDSRSSKDLVTGDEWSGNYNLEFSFVQRSSGWIGLAIIGNNQTCQSNIWCRYLASYRGSNVAREWTTLIKHELGHNCGKQHTRGGVMNPSIVSGLPADWATNDPSYNWLRSRFGGEPVPMDDDRTPPPGGDSLETRVADLETTVLVQSIAIRDLYQRIPQGELR